MLKSVAIAFATIIALVGFFVVYSSVVPTIDTSIASGLFAPPTS